MESSFSNHAANQADSSTAAGARKRQKRSDDKESSAHAEERNAAAPAAKATSHSAPSSEILGLEFLDGRILYCPRSTLVNAGGFLAARFDTSDRFAAEPPTRLDKYGRNAYFVARNGELFERHILEFIIKKRPGQLPPFSQNPELWRSLRDEALFFALHDLCEMLHVTHSCPFDMGDDRGVLHWLGTQKGTSEYTNPHAIDAVGVYVGGMDEGLSVVADELHPLAFTPESRQALVQAVQTSNQRGDQTWSQDISPIILL